MKFLELQWGEDPNEKLKRETLAKLIEDQRQILFTNTKLQRMRKESPEVFSYIDKNITAFEKNLKNDKIAEGINTKEGYTD